MSISKTYRNDIDGLKAIAIVAVIFFHMGFLPQGYLGVDLFLVISGFLTTISIQKKQEEQTFSYWKYIKQRITRLYPSLFAIMGLSLAIGYFLMLPDDYENLSESVIASNFFANNILEAITTKNYWDVVNDFKPLMHTWYLGVEMQILIIYPIIFLLFNKNNQNKKRYLKKILGSFIIISFTIYSLPFFSNAEKFYYIPFRFFEFGIGGFVGLLDSSNRQVAKSVRIGGGVQLITMKQYIISFTSSSSCSL